MSRVLLVEQYFYPDGWGGAEIPRDIAVALRQAGADVEVLCGADQYAPLPPGAVSRDPTAQGVRILRIPRIMPGPARRLRMLRILWFCICAAPVLLLRRRVGLIITQTNPPLIVPTVALVAGLRRVPFIIIAQDVYPDVLFASGSARRDSPAGRALVRLFAWSYRRARSVVVLGPFMRRRIASKGVSPGRIVTISNWATGQIGGGASGRDNPLRSRWGLQDRLVILYSGNLGVGHEFETFLEGVRQAATKVEKLVVVFVGAGSRLEEVRQRAQTLGVAARVQFRDFVRAEDLPLSMGIADIALVTLRQGFEGVIVPSKLLGYMARGIPALYVGPESDISVMIREAECGVCCAPGDAGDVAQLLCRAAADAALLRRWGANGQSFYAQHFACEHALERYVDLAKFAFDGGRLGAHTT